MSGRKFKGRCNRANLQKGPFLVFTPMKQIQLTKRNAFNKVSTLSDTFHEVVNKVVETAQKKETRIVGAVIFGIITILQGLSAYALWFVFTELDVSYDSLFQYSMIFFTGCHRTEDWIINCIYTHMRVLSVGVLYCMYN